MVRTLSACWNGTLSTPTMQANHRIRCSVFFLAELKPRELKPHRTSQSKNGARLIQTFIRRRHSHLRQDENLNDIWVKWRRLQALVSTEPDDTGLYLFILFWLEFRLLGSRSPPNVIPWFNLAYKVQLSLARSEPSPGCLSVWVHMGRPESLLYCFTSLFYNTKEVKSIYLLDNGPCPAQVQLVLYCHRRETVHSACLGYAMLWAYLAVVVEDQDAQERSRISLI